MKKTFGKRGMFPSRIAGVALATVIGCASATQERTPTANHAPSAGGSPSGGLAPSGDPSISRHRSPSARPSPSPWEMRDRYASYEELTRENREGRDFEILARDGRRPELVMAIHGGNIETGTTELAEVVAGDDLGFYSFIGKHADIERLHVTSTRFDEPTLLAMLEDANRCLSLHGFFGDETDFCVGGGDAAGRVRYVEALRKEFPDYGVCDACCPPYIGTSKRNVVNRCGEPGVQIEMSPAVRERIVEDEGFRVRLGRVLRGLFVGR